MEAHGIDDRQGDLEFSVAALLVHNKRFVVNTTKTAWPQCGDHNRSMQELNRVVRGVRSDSRGVLWGLAA